MREKPILFSGPMVRAILEGRKTQTRRICDGRISEARSSDMQCWLPDGDGNFIGWTSKDTPENRAFCLREYPAGHGDGIKCPYGKSGDTLWVREAWCHKIEEGKPVYNSEGNLDSSCVWYKADGQEVFKADGDGFAEFRKDGFAASPWKPSIHMPRWASRITLGIKAVRVERLNDISESDAVAEGLWKQSKDDGCVWKYGIPDRDGMPGNDDDGWYWKDWRINPVEAYRRLWESIHGAGSWEMNPWVWVVEFEKIANGKLKAKGEEV